MITLRPALRVRPMSLGVHARHPLVVAMGAMVVAAAAGLALAASAGAGPAEVADALIEGTLGSPFAIGTSLNSAALLMLVAAGFTVAYRAGLVNVGGEGQLCLGGIAATAVGVGLPAGLPAGVGLAAAHLPLLGLHKSPATIAILLALVLIAAVGITLQHSAAGLRLRAVGLSGTASARLGVPVDRTAMFGLTAAGAFSGLAGGFLVTTAPFILADGFSSGFGFAGLVVGLLARGSMIAVAAVSLLFGFLVSGGINLQLAAGVPSSTITVVQSVLIIVIAGAAWWTSAGARQPRKVAA